MEKLKDGKAVLYFKNKDEWRHWLEANHQDFDGIWLVFFHQKSGQPTLKYEEAVEEALCFGWIDSKPNKRDSISYYRYFSKRKPKSNWSAINKEKIAQLITENKMSEAGMEMVRIAKETGTWDALNEVDRLIVPNDLSNAFEENPAAFDNWKAFPPSSKKIILEWILNAKRSETRLKRIKDTIKKAEKNIRANHYRQPKKDGKQKSENRK